MHSSGMAFEKNQVDADGMRNLDMHAATLRGAMAMTQSCAGRAFGLLSACITHFTHRHHTVPYVAVDMIVGPQQVTPVL
jgi:hypothetical protein